MKTRAFTLIALCLIAGCATQRGPGGEPNAQRPPSVGSDNGTRGPANAGPYDTSTPPASPSAGQASGPRTTTGPAPQRPPAPPKTASEASSPAVMSLLGRADTLAQAGQMGMAASSLERALDLQPRNPFVYQRLAAVRLAQGQAGQAEQLANKSNSVAGDNPFVQADNWRLIAEARRSQGDGSGAENASQRAVNYQQATGRFSGS